MNFIVVSRVTFKEYLSSPLAWFIVGCSWMITGIYINDLLFSPNSIINQSNFSTLGSSSNVISTDIFEIILGDLFYFLGSLSLWILPLLALVFDLIDNRTRLVNDHASNYYVVTFGQFWARLLFLPWVLLPLVLIEMVVISSFKSEFNMDLLLLLHGSFLLLGAAIISCQMLFSSLIKSHFLSLLLTFCFLVILSLLELEYKGLSGNQVEIITQISLFSGYKDLVYGNFQLNHIVTILNYIVLGLFLTIQSRQAISLWK